MHDTHVAHIKQRQLNMSHYNGVHVAVSDPPDCKHNCCRADVAAAPIISCGSVGCVLVYGSNCDVVQGGATKDDRSMGIAAKLHRCSHDLYNR